MSLRFHLSLFPSTLYAHPPMGQAKGILAFIQARHPDKNYDVKGVMSEPVNYDRSPDYVSEGFSDTVSEIVSISAKTTRTMLRTLSLLKTPG
ncbi:MAG: hypothetical protein NTX75_08315 [Proteobacteria bacterium]|nr:hypothetical protein [Pseudomonadota bacterium]